MAIVKRKAEAMEDQHQPSYVSPFIPNFEFFRGELDEHHDRRERIIKASRDITAQSKKVIFALQRVRELGCQIQPSISKQTDSLYSTIWKLMESVVPDLQGINANRYQYNISGGIQEYMEAVLFQHYLETQCLLSYHDAAATLVSGLTLTYEDYVLGVFDMTGELMRFAITYMATHGALPGTNASSNMKISILADMQDLRSQLEAMNASGIYSLKEFDSKLRVTRQSVEKVENGVYSMLVRGKERPKGWRPDTNLDEGGPGEIESY